MAEYLQQKDVCNKSDEIDPTKQSKQEESNNLLSQQPCTASYGNKHEKSHRNPAEYAQQRRLHPELRRTDQVKMSSLEQQHNLVQHREITISSGDANGRRPITPIKNMQREGQHHEMNRQRTSLAEQQRNLFRRQKFATLPSDEHREEFVTLARYIELKALDPIWFDTNESFPSSIEPQNCLSVNVQLTTSSIDEHEIGVMRMAEYMRQKFLCHKSLQVYESAPSSMEQQDCLQINSPFIISAGNKHRRPLMTLSEYAQRRRLHHEQHEKDQLRTSSTEQFPTLSDDKHLDEFVTLAQYIELKGLDPAAFELNESVASPMEDQNQQLRNSDKISSSSDKQEMRAIRMVTFLTQTFLRQMHELLACRKQQRRDRRETELLQSDRKDVQTSMLHSDVGHVKFEEVLSVKLHALPPNNPCKFDNYSEQPKHRVLSVLSRSEHKNNEPTRVKKRLMTHMRRGILECFCQCHMQETPTINRQNIV